MTAANENELYIDFVPLFIKTWNKLYPDVDVKIILIAKNIPDDLLSFKKNIILFEPIEDVLTSFTSQIIRLLYPCILNYKNGILITDIDMIPLSNTYFTQNILNFDKNKFIYYRGDVCFDEKQIAMCYNVATPEIWKDIFKINSIDDIKLFIKDINSKNTIQEEAGKTGLFLDQLTLYNKVLEWNNITNNFIRLNEEKTGFKRLNIYRFLNYYSNNLKIINSEIFQNCITEQLFTDYHCLRPMKKYSKINWYIYNILK